MLLPSASDGLNKTASRDSTVASLAEVPVEKSADLSNELQVLQIAARLDSLAESRAERQYVNSTIFVDSHASTASADRFERLLPDSSASWKDLRVKPVSTSLLLLLILLVFFF